MRLPLFWCGHEQRGIGGRSGHVVDRAGMYPSDERIHQAIGHSTPELVGDQGPDGAVAHRAPQVGTGSTASRAG